MRFDFLAQLFEVYFVAVQYCQDYFWLGAAKTTQKFKVNLFHKSPGKAEFKGLLVVNLTFRSEIYKLFC